MYKILTEIDDPVYKSRLCVLVKDYYLRITIENLVAMKANKMHYVISYGLYHASQSDCIVAGYHDYDGDGDDEQINRMLERVDALKVISGVLFNANAAKREIKQWYEGVFDSLMCKDIIE